VRIEFCCGNVVVIIIIIIIIIIIAIIIIDTITTTTTCALPRDDAGRTNTCVASIMSQFFWSGTLTVV